MVFKELLEKRQSDRKYSTRAVESEKIMQCIEVAHLSPSACNAQPWKFIVIDNPKLKTEVAEATASMGMNKFTLDVPAIVAIVLEKPNLTSKIGSILKDKEYTLIDIGIVANNFCLQAAELGLGTCMIGWFNEKKVRKLLEIPSNKRIPLLISVGYPTEPTRQKIRKDLNAIYSKNKY